MGSNYARNVFAAAPWAQTVMVYSEPRERVWWLQISFSPALRGANSSSPKPISWIRGPTSRRRKKGKRTLLGITVRNTLTFYHHISALVAKSARSFYALKTIRAHGSIEMCYGTRHTGLTTHIFKSLPGGDISKSTKGTGFSRSLRRQHCTGLSPDTSALWAN